jgi:hypothetical protein
MVNLFMHKTRQFVRLIRAMSLAFAQSENLASGDAPGPPTIQISDPYVYKTPSKSPY